MRITTNSDQTIFSVTPDDNASTGILYTGSLPSDFYQTFAIGKYKFDGTNIVAVPGWVKPTYRVRDIRK